MPDLNPVIKKSTSGILSGVYRYTYVLNNPLKYTDPSGYWYKKKKRKKKRFWKNAHKGKRNLDNPHPSYSNSDDEYEDSEGGGGFSYSPLFTSPFSGSGYSYSSNVSGQVRSGGGGGSGSGIGNGSPGDPPKELDRTSQSNPLPPGPWSNETFDQSYDWTIEYSNPGIDLPEGFLDGENREVGDYLDGFSIFLGAASYRIGSHMNSVSRFRPVYQYGRQIYPATSRYRFGPINGTFATKLAPALKYGGGVLGGLSIGYSITMLATNNTDDPFKTSLDLGVGVVSFFGPIGLGMSAVYFGIDTFYPGGIYQFSTDYVNQQMDFYNSFGFSIRTFMH